MLTIKNLNKKFSKLKENINKDNYKRKHFKNKSVKVYKNKEKYNITNK